MKDAKLREIVENIVKGKSPGFHKDDKGTLWFGKMLYVPEDKTIRKAILSEAHESAYSIYPKSTKMYLDLREKYWWYGLKRDVAEYVALCDTCQRVKAEHQRPAGLLQPMQIPEWKWEEVGMNFIVGLPRTQRGYDSIWVIVDRLTKVAHFLPARTTYSSARLAELYMERIVSLHGVPKKIVSDRGTQFTSHYWQKIHESLGTKLNFSTAYHPQTDGQMERINQILKDMLRACVYNMVLVGIRVCLMQSSHITIVIRKVFRWHRLRLCMDESVEPRCSGIRQGKVKCLGLMYSRMLKRK
jgi:hypothetical protein